MPTKIEKDAISGQNTTGHEWDGVKELNTPLPRWWILTFYVSIAWAIGYWVLYPAWPLVNSYTPGLLGYHSRSELASDIAAAKAQQQKYLDVLAKSTVAEIQQDPQLRDFAIAGGRSAFSINCAPCHGAGAAGGKGYPNLVDDDWLWGGALEAIQTTVTHGIRWDADGDTRQNQMPAFLKDNMLKAAQINDVAEYVLSLSKRGSDAAAAERGAKTFGEQCVACHKEGGVGNPELGAPRLDDAIWLYGGDKASIVQTISYARRGVMPAWTGRLDPVTIKELTVYVHSLGGGQ